MVFSCWARFIRFVSPWNPSGSHGEDVMGSGGFGGGGAGCVFGPAGIGPRRGRSALAVFAPVLAGGGATGAGVVSTGPALAAGWNIALKLAVALLLVELAARDEAGAAGRWGA